MNAVVIIFALLFGQTDVADHLQDVSVTIKAGQSEGSGVIKTRDFNGTKVNFVWTAAHVVDGLRKTREIVDPATGSTKTVIEFNDAQIVKELVEDGRRVGELKMDAKVVKFSDYRNGEDLALLMIRKKGFVDTSVEFYLGNDIPKIGTEFYHVGSLLGQMGANSMTRGIMSQVGRVVDNKVFDQTTVAAFPGSSGGGVYTTDGKYVGMVVRGAGETFNLIVPVRRIHEWAKKSGIEFAIRDDVAVPTMEELEKTQVEETGITFKSSAAALPPISLEGKEYKFLIRNRQQELIEAFHNKLK